LRRQLVEAADGDVEVLPDAVLDAVDAAVHGDLLAAVPGVLDDAGVADVGDLLDDVKLAEAVDSLIFLLELGEVVAVFIGEVADGAQPAVDQAELAVVQRSAHATAAIVASDQDVLHLEYIDGKLDDRQAVEVGVQDDVGDVAVDEQVAGQQADDLVGRHACIGTTDPQVFRSLLAGQFGEELGVFLLNGFGPAGIVVEQFLQIAHVRLLIIGWRHLTQHGRG